MANSQTTLKRARRLAKRKQQTGGPSGFFPPLFGSLMTRAAVFHPAVASAGRESDRRSNGDEFVPDTPAEVLP